MIKAIIQIVVLWGGMLCFSFTQKTQDTSAYQRSVTKLLILRNTKMGSDTLQGADSLFAILDNEIFPAWYGTPWDFNGISNVPGKGQIACGYFVSTTLKHAGFNLNRYHLAQQASAIITKEICGEANTQTFHGFDHLIAYLKSKNNAFFVVGLDYHVGFIVVKNGEPFFVHSDYLGGNVIRERVATSESLKSSQGFVLGELSNNPELLNKWHKGVKIYE